MAGHNIRGFDLPCLEKVAGVRLTAVVEDTLEWSRLCYSDRAEQDWKLVDKGLLSKKSVGKHGLEAWGERLGEPKGECEDFSVFTQDMLTYCIQDVRVNLKLWEHLASRLPDFISAWDGVDTVELEAWFASFCQCLKDEGVPFDTKAAEELLGRLLVRRAELDDQLHAAFPPRKVMYAVNAKTGKQTFRTDPETGEKTDHKLVPFNPGSRQELADRLQEKYGWQPGKFTTSGDVEMVESVLLELAEQYPEAKLAAERFIIQARVGILREGNGSYLNLLGPDKRIHGTILHIGAVTHRCAHRSPNLGNPTSVRKPYGLDMRRLFTAVPGYILAGGDASGLELRMLAHYLGAWDEGAYARVVDGGDVHTLHRDAIREYTGFAVDRDQTKTIGYAWLYGAGDLKLGSVVGKGAGAGKRIREALRTRIAGMDPLLAGLERRLSTVGSVTSLDGRRVGIRHKHGALNSLLQTAGAVVMRWFLYYLQRNCEGRKIRWWKDYIPHLFVHDEIQGSLRPGLEAEFETAFSAAFDDTRIALGLRVPLKGEIKYGNNWAETH